MAVRSLSPLEKESRALRNPIPPFAGAQLAADMGNISAPVRACQKQPRLETINDHRRAIIEKCYPAPIEERGSHLLSKKRPLTLQGKLSIPKPKHSSRYSDETAIAAINHVTTGKAAGHIGDITDLFTDMALSLDRRTRKRQYGKQWDQWFELLGRGDILEKVREEYPSVWFSALYKDYDGDRDKLRPTVCGTGLRRLSESFIAYILYHLHRVSLYTLLSLNHYGKGQQLAFVVNSRCKVVWQDRLRHS